MQQPAEHPSNSWYAVRVRSNFERFASIAIDGMGYEQYSPVYRTRRRWSDRVKEIDAPLFPGYIFARLDPNNRLPILMAPGVVEIVGMAKQPIPIPDCEIEAVRRILHTSAKCGPWPFLQKGQHIRIEQGPLTGIEGILQEVKGHFRLIVSVSLLQRSVSVEIEREFVHPINPPRILPRHESLVSTDSRQALSS